MMCATNRHPFGQLLEFGSGGHDDGSLEDREWPVSGQKASPLKGYFTTNRDVVW